MKAPCVNSLSAMPGDRIEFLTNVEGMHVRGTVMTAGWQPAPKGGKIWTYETNEGTLVAHTQVVKIEKHNFNVASFPMGEIPTEAMQSKPTHKIGGMDFEHAPPPHQIVGGNQIDQDIDLTQFLGGSISPEISLRQELMSILEKLNLQSTYKVAIACILEGDADSIQVAADLLKIRARQLKELAACGPGFGAFQAPTTNPLKEDDNE